MKKRLFTAIAAMFLMSTPSLAETEYGCNYDPYDETTWVYEYQPCYPDVNPIEGMFMIFQRGMEGIGDLLEDILVHGEVGETVIFDTGEDYYWEEHQVYYDDAAEGIRVVLRSGGNFVKLLIVDVPRTMVEGIAQAIEDLLDYED